MSGSDLILDSFTIEHDIDGADLRSIEVRVVLTNGPDRWCFFATPAGLATFGDWLPGTNVRFHLGVPHMIVVSEIDEDVIKNTLELLDENGELITHTRSVADS